MKYLVERFVLAATWAASFASIWFIARDKFRESSFIYSFTQFITWILGLLAVENRLLEYPVREMERANGTSLTFEYLVFPLICVFFNIYFPEKRSIKRKISYYILFTSVLNFLEFLLERFTRLINYISWEWYCTFITVTLTFYIVRVTYKWFFRLEKPFSL